MPTSPRTRPSWSAARSSSPNAARAATPARFPTALLGMDAGEGCSGKDYLNCWNKYWAWTKTDDFKTEDARHRPAAGLPRWQLSFHRHARSGDAAADQRVQPAGHQCHRRQHLGQLLLAHLQGSSVGGKHHLVPPGYRASREPTRCPAGGRGYTRPASLISAWSTAPFLQNNTVGKFNASPSVEARMDSFQDSIEQMLWPEKRDKDQLLGDKVPGTHRPHHHDQLPSRSVWISARSAEAFAEFWAALLPVAVRRRRHRDWADPRRNAGRPAGQSRFAGRDNGRRRQGGASGKSGGPCCSR